MTTYILATPEPALAVVMRALATSRTVCMADGMQVLELLSRQRQQQDAERERIAAEKKEAEQQAVEKPAVEKRARNPPRRKPHADHPQA
jgi:hypothetical protein